MPLIHSDRVGDALMQTHILQTHFPAERTLTFVSPPPSLSLSFPSNPIWSHDVSDEQERKKGRETKMHQNELLAFVRELEKDSHSSTQNIHRVHTDRDRFPMQNSFMHRFFLHEERETKKRGKTPEANTHVCTLL
jgi:hypothetical protein